MQRLGSVSSSSKRKYYNNFFLNINRIVLIIIHLMLNTNVVRAAYTEHGVTFRLALLKLTRTSQFREIGRPLEDLIRHPNDCGAWLEIAK